MRAAQHASKVIRTRTVYVELRISNLRKKKKIRCFRYQVDGNARVTAIDVTIGNKELTQLKLKYNQNIGTLESISDLRIYKNTFNKSVIHDTAKQFFSISEYDNHGRLKSVMTNIKSMDVYRYVFCDVKLFAKLSRYSKSI